MAVRPLGDMIRPDSTRNVAITGNTGPNSLNTAMHTPLSPSASVAVPPHRSGVGWRYLLLLTMQTVGAYIFYRNGLPWYRDLLADPTAYEARPDTRIWALSAIALVQVGYWVCYRVRPPPPRFTNVVLGHFVLFLARMSFLLATTVFSFVFFAQKLASRMPISRYVLMSAGLFSLFCYMQELQRLGGRLVGQERRS